MGFPPAQFRAGLISKQLAVGRSTDDLEFQSCKPGNLLKFADDMADAEGAMVRRSRAAISIKEGRRIEGETQTAVRVANIKPSPC